MNCKLRCSFSNDPSDLTCLPRGDFLTNTNLKAYPERNVKFLSLGSLDGKDVPNSNKYSENLGLQNILILFS